MKSLFWRSIYIPTFIAALFKIAKTWNNPSVHQWMNGKRKCNIYAYTHAHIHTYIYIYTHTYMHIHACTHTNTCTYSEMLFHHKKRQKSCHLWQHGLESITRTEINQKDKYCMISLICESEKPILIDTKSRMVVAKSWTMEKMRKDVGQRLQT